ncbi:GlxA family transcriptional regulator [Vibrio rumoiensis]|uniref:HTH araC/xylS-type domain-containing protein n=1 Tax=Vibrio rumoiensis 1S-45 TaxID=1188252 RepID=A0A1E5E0X0_9VIBR|nr:helix-turn-helix domain-containing protein [Vibrio rumoiensis]OEF23847.1 hypothetical protein A1QC_11000 [Vibrio rumoiensis 1S-45]
MADKSQATVEIVVFIPEQCSPLDLSSVVEPFELTNKQLGYEKYQLRYASQKQGQLSISSYLTLSVDYTFNDEFDCDVLIILNQYKPSAPLPQSVKKRLQDLYQQKNIEIFAGYAGVFWLAESGLLAKGTSALHWSMMDEFNDAFSQLDISVNLYESLNRITTCSGRVAMLDCMINWLETQESRELVHALSEQLCMDRIRPANERQNIPSNHLGGDLQPRLTMSIERMESNIEEPLSMDEIADSVNISRRQLERLFKRYLNCMPAKYYFQLRLKKARQLLLNTNKSIIQIGLCCGFSSGPHFSSAYKTFYGLTPREERTALFNVKE